MFVVLMNIFPSVRSPKLHLFRFCEQDFLFGTETRFLENDRLGVISDFSIWVQGLRT